MKKRILWEKRDSNATKLFEEEIMNLDLGLTGKTAIITGGAAGIGNMTAAYLLSRA